MEGISESTDRSNFSFSAALAPANSADRSFLFIRMRTSVFILSASIPQSMKSEAQTKTRDASSLEIQENVGDAHSCVRSHPVANVFIVHRQISEDFFGMCFQCGQKMLIFCFFETFSAGDGPGLPGATPPCTAHP